MMKYKVSNIITDRNSHENTSVPFLNAYNSNPILLSKSTESKSIETSFQPINTELEAIKYRDAFTIRIRLSTPKSLRISRYVSETRTSTSAFLKEEVKLLGIGKVIRRLT
jgi:hypothetical protein